MFNNNNNNPILRSLEVFKSEIHDVYTLKLNKIALSRAAMMIKDYRHMINIQHPYGSSVGKVCKTELLNKVKQIA